MDDDKKTGKRKLLESAGFTLDNKSHSWFKSGKQMVFADDFEDSSLEAIKEACKRYKKTGNWELNVD